MKKSLTDTSKNTHNQWVTSSATQSPKPQGNLTVVSSNSHPSNPKNDQETCPFRSLIRDWLNYCRSEGLSDKTIGDYREKTFKFWWWWSQHTRYAEKLGPHPENVGIKEAREFAAYLREPLPIRWGLRVPAGKEKLSVASVTAYGRTVKVFFAWLEREGYIEVTPFSNKSVKFTNKHKQDKVIKTLQGEDLNRILLELAKPESLQTYAGMRNMAIIALLIDSGMRRGELLSLRLCDIDLKKNRCVIRGKTGQRHAFFHDLCRNTISDYLQQYRQEQNEDQQSPLWLCEDGEALTDGGFGIMIRRLEKRSGVDFHAHRLRHTFATTMSQHGVNVFDLKEMLGHSSITTTQIYVQNNHEHLSEVHRANSPLANLPVSSQFRRRGRPRKGS